MTGCDGSCSRICGHYYYEPETGEWGCLHAVMWECLRALLRDWWGEP